MAAIPFIDIFAGPGGLSEGFSRYAEFARSPASFVSRLAIEKDPVAVHTLQLRSFLRSFGKEIPDTYYRFLRGQIAFSELQADPRWPDTAQHVWQAELGAEPEPILHERISKALNGATTWVLLGGPPCQAYSVVGRSRMTGIGAAARDEEANLDELWRERQSKFIADHRHKLYREYLRIVAVHQPSIFVMENVKGILSARLRESPDDEGELVFQRIREDLSKPWQAIAHDAEYELLDRLRNGSPQEYTLYSLVVGGERTGRSLQDREFAIRSEDYGVPQRRHRVIILGVRNDISTKPHPLGRQAMQRVSDALVGLPALRSEVSRRTAAERPWRAAIEREVRRVALRSTGDRRVRAIISCFCANGDVLDRGANFQPAPTISPARPLQEWYWDRQLGGVCQHFARSHMVSDLARYLYAAASAAVWGRSPGLQDWPINLLPNHQNVTIDAASGRPKATGFSDRFKVQVWDQPSSTVTSHIHKDGHYFIHPDPMQCRSLTVREAARLQTFPDNYYFCGNRTQQYQQVGNAVPPYLACQIAGVVAKLMEEAGLAEDCDG